MSALGSDDDKSCSIGVNRLCREDGWTDCNGANGRGEGCKSMFCRQEKLGRAQAMFILMSSTRLPSI